MQQRGAIEQTVVVTMEIPGGGDWRWMPELNLTVLSPQLDELGRQRALDEAQAMWRANCVPMTA